MSESRFALAMIDDAYLYHTARRIHDTERSYLQEVRDLKAREHLWANNPLVVVVQVLGTGADTHLVVVDLEQPQSKPSRPPMNSPEVRIAQWLWRLSQQAHTEAGRDALSWASGAIARGEHDVEVADNMPAHIFKKR